jgi:metallo-beta-lactamase class B
MKDPAPKLFLPDDPVLLPGVDRIPRVLFGGDMLQKAAIVWLGLILALLLASSALAQNSPDWTEPFPAFRVAGNLYYVGSKGLANYLITTPQGNILINSDLESNVPMIKASIEKLGFKFEDTKILHISHAHWDHDAGSAKIEEMTGASYVVMDADVPVVESGGKADFQYGDNPNYLYPPTKVDRVLHERRTTKPDFVAIDQQQFKSTECGPTATRIHEMPMRPQEG